VFVTCNSGKKRNNSEPEEIDGLETDLVVV